MKISFSAMWAMTASAIALVLAGILIGQNLTKTQAVAAAGPQSTEPGGDMMIDPYVIPKWLENAPKEWRSTHNGSHSGYAILFDADHRELLVEQCHYPGVFDQAKNLPIENAGFQCERLLTGTLMVFDDNGAIVKRKDGAQITVNIEPISAEQPDKLNLAFDSHELALIPGQPNDLLQEILKTPAIVAQNQLLFEFNQQQLRQHRARLAANADEDEIPRFKLPQSVIDEQEEAIRRADLANH